MKKAKAEDQNKIVRLCSYFTRAEAELNRNLLKKAGIDSAIQRGNLGVAAEFSGSAGDAYILVKRKDFKKAREVLDIDDINDKRV